MAVAPDGRWIAACQARSDTDGDGKVAVQVGHHGDLRGDATHLYLFQGHGEGERIDSLEAQDPQGRWLTTVEEGSLTLRDTQGGPRIKLDGFVPSVDSREDFQLAAFSADGKHLIYLRKAESGRIVPVLRRLTDGHEQVLTAPPGELHVVDFIPESSRPLFVVLQDDTDGDGTLHWPRQQTNLARGVCRGEAMSATFFGRRGDRPRVLVGAAGDGAPREIPDLVRTMGDGLVRRAASGAILVESASGSVREWVPSTCRGEVLHVDAGRQLLLVACTAQQTQPHPRFALAPLWLYGPSLPQPVALGIGTFHAADGHGLTVKEGARVVGLAAADIGVKPGPLRAPGALIDLDRRSAQPFARGEVVVVHGSKAVVKEYGEGERPSTRTVLVDLESGERRELPAILDTYFPTLASGSLVAVDGIVLDLATGELLGQLPEHAEALDAQGRALVPATAGRPPRGPTHWAPLAPLPEPKAPSQAP